MKTTAKRLGLTAIFVAILLIVSGIVYVGYSAYSESKKHEEALRIASLNDMQRPIEVNGSMPDVPSMLRIVNSLRLKQGVDPLVIDSRLNASAQLKADDMNMNSYFDHKSPLGKQGYEYIPETMGLGSCVYVSENIQYTPATKYTAEQAIENWRTSESHYKAMIDPRYSLTGFGIANGYIVEHFCQTS